MKFMFRYLDRKATSWSLVLKGETRQLTDLAHCKFLLNCRFAASLNVQLLRWTGLDIYGLPEVTQRLHLWKYFPQLIYKRQCLNQAKSSGKHIKQSR